MSAGSVMQLVTDQQIVPRTVSGALRVAQALARRFSTPRGQLFYDLNYGLDLVDRIQDLMSARDMTALRAQIKAEALKDEDVTRCEVEASFDQGSGILTAIVRAYGPNGLSVVNITATKTGVTATT